MLTLLSAPTANPKLAKNAKMGVLSAPLHLAPASLSGWNVCAMASKGCIAACLHTAGMPAHMAGKTRARIERTRAYFTDRELFMQQLVKEIGALERKAAKLHMQCAVRLNATSDIMWENVAVGGQKNIMRLFPNVQFYDYTKIAKRLKKGYKLPRNYHLTFSKSESNDEAVQEIVSTTKHNVAVVFAVTPRGALPAKYLGRRVIDGDDHDARYLDKKNSIIGLRAKGKARGDKSGFVVTL